MISDRARLTVLNPALAHAHEHSETPGCLLAPDGDTCCPNPAAWRIELDPIPGHDDTPTTFVCDQHHPWMAVHPAVSTMRKLTP